MLTKDTNLCGSRLKRNLFILLGISMASIFNYVSAQVIELPVRRVHTPEEFLPDVHEFISEEEAKRRGLQNVNITMTNYQDLQYHATLLMGSSQFSQTFIWDTGSTLLWTPLANCSNCPSSNKYTAAGSYTSTGTRHTITYAQGSVDGTIASDDVRLNASSSNFRMEILGVDSASADLSGLQSDGVLGMGPRISSGRPGTLLVEALHDAGIIGSNSFGVEYKFTNETSSILLGGYDTSKVANESLFSWINLKSTSHWNVDLNGFQYGGVDISLTANTGTLDTGTSYTLFMQEDFDKLYTQMTTGKTCGFISGSSRRTCECNSTSEFSEMRLHLGGYYTYMPATAYVTFIDNLITQDLCVFTIDSYTANLGDIVLLGDSFLREYYIYHDAADTRVGLFGRTQEGSEMPSLTLALFVLAFLFLEF